MPSPLTWLRNEVSTIFIIIFFFRKKCLVGKKIWSKIFVRSEGGGVEKFLVRKLFCSEKMCNEKQIWVRGGQQNLVEKFRNFFWSEICFGQKQILFRCLGGGNVEEEKIVRKKI